MDAYRQRGWTVDGTTASCDHLEIGGYQYSETITFSIDGQGHLIAETTRGDSGNTETNRADLTQQWGGYTKARMIEQWIAGISPAGH